MTSSRALFVIQSHLSVGGIEAYFAKLMRGCVKSGDRVFWLCDDSPKIDDALLDYLQGVNIVPVRTRRIHRYIIPALNLKGVNRAAIVCAYTKHLAFAERLRDYLNKEERGGVKTSAFYLMPHFTGYSQFPDTAFHGLLGRLIFKRYRTVVKKWIERDELIYFARKHFMALKEHYHFQLDEESMRLVPFIEDDKPFDCELARRKAEQRNNQFSIVSAARFEFPHKGYLLGLIDEFAKLVDEFPQARLVIIGDGPNVNDLLDKIGQQKQFVRDRIIRRGFVSPEELEKETRLAHLNVGMAGSLAIGAREGTLSLPTRHYTLLCESPGYLSPAAQNTLIVSACGSAYEFLRQAITMDDDEYVKRCYDSYSAVRREAPDYSFFFNFENKVDAARITRGDLRFVRWCMYAIGIKAKLEQCKKR